MQHIKEMRNYTNIYTDKDMTTQHILVNNDIKI